MKESARNFPLVSLCFGIMIGASGCGKTELTLANNTLVFSEGAAETKSIAVKSGTADQVDPVAAVDGLSAQVDGAAIKVTATGEVKPGSYEFTVLGNRRKSKATFTVTVSARAAVAPPVGKDDPPPVVQPVADPLALQDTYLRVAPGTHAWATAAKGVIKHAESRAKFLKAELDGPNRLKIAVDKGAPPSENAVRVFGEIGPEVYLTVRVPVVPTPAVSALGMENKVVELTAGEKKLVKVATGWANFVEIVDPATKVKTEVEGLTVAVENDPIRVFITSEGIGYKKDDELTVAGGPGTGTAQLKVVSVDRDGAILSVALIGNKKYLPLLRTVNLPASGGSGTEAMFNLTNNVKIIADEKLRAGKYEVLIKGPGGAGQTLGVVVNAPTAGAVRRLAPLETEAAFARMRDERE